MLIRKSSDIRSSEITPEEAFLTHSSDRRRFLTTAATLGAGAVVAAGICGLVDPRGTVLADTQALQTVASKYTVPDAQTPYSKATTYNNFYEFGEDKSDPAHNAHTLQTRPWTIQVDGLVAKPLTLNIDDVMHYRPLESRVYRHRCVERWSMVVPWDGYSLSELIKFCQPLPSAKYVQFISDLNKKQMPDLPWGFDWPYSEGLRMDEAMNPLALLCFGCYGKVLPNQNGAPIRVVLPWKYGFKSAKSIVKFHFTDKQPRTLWNEANPEAYGFYSNVNPSVDTPWSQANERRIDSSAFPKTIPTQPFNGYADQVAGMYAGMDLQKYY
jgi:sulfoxide reductase catalytic subunit YedY